MSSLEVMVKQYIKPRKKSYRYWDRFALYKNGKLFTTYAYANYVNADTLRSGYVNPRWKSQISAGVNATTPFSDSEKKVAVHSYYGVDQLLKISSNQWRTVARGKSSAMMQLPNLALTVPLLAAADLEARENAYGDLSRHFEGLVALGELRETIRMLKNPAMALRKGVSTYLSSARNIRQSIANTTRLSLPKRRSEYAKAVSGTWLEYHFGWKPLLADIQGIFQTVKDRVGEPEYKRFKGVGIREKFVNETTVSGIQFTQTDHKVQQKCTAFVKYYGEAKSIVQSSLPDALGFIPQAFIPAAWELMPWSFVIDYFVNIGAVLNAHAIASRIGYKYCNRVERKIVLREVSSIPRVSSAYKQYLLNGNYTVGTSSSWSKSVVRSSADQVPLPYLSAEFQLNLGRSLNLAALAHQQVADHGFRPPRRH